MPLWYWQKIAEYKIDVDAIKKYLYGLRDISGGMNEKAKETRKKVDRVMQNREAAL
jgi:hypothetical protein